MLAALAFVGLVAFSPASYAEFAKRGQRIKPKMTKAEVVAILGEPAVVWTDADPSPFYSDRETWAWGVEGRYSFPTRGKILFDRRGKVAFAELPKPDSITAVSSDEEVAKSIRVIDRILRPGGPFSNTRVGPLERIRLVNYCVSLGEERAATALSLYDDCEGGSRNWLIYPIINLLYPPKPDALETESTYPFVVVDGVPLDISVWKFFSGSVSSFSWILREHRKTKVFRRQPLEPSGDPFELNETLKETPAWKAPIRGIPSWNPKHALENVNAEIEDLLRTCLDSKVSDSRTRWAELERQGVHWNRQRSAYVRNDGFFRPDYQVPAPFKHAVTLPGHGNVRLTIERNRPPDLQLSLTFPQGVKRKPLRLSFTQGARSSDQSIDFEKYSPEALGESIAPNFRIEDDIIYLKLTQNASGPVKVRIDTGHGAALSVNVPEFPVE